MDGLQRFEEEYGSAAWHDEPVGAEPVFERPPEIGTDERRMQVRAYNHWVSMLGGRDYPSIEDLDVENVGDFGPHGVLLDFTSGAENPGTPFIGGKLATECGLTDAIKEISQVPKRSLLSRLTDHYLQIIANRAPIGFEAEFVSQRGCSTMYRGILMPLSSDGDTIDFIYGVINWKELADAGTTAGLASQLAGQIAGKLSDRIADQLGATRVPAPAPLHSPVWADGPSATPESAPVPIGIHDEPPVDEEELEEEELEEEGEDVDDLVSALPDDAGLADRLCIARETAEGLKSADTRSRAALYRALGCAYDFALAARDAPQDYLEILEDAGLKAQNRAPMTPIAKLIFGIDYDKTRLTEFAAALGHGLAAAIPAGAFTSYLERTPGGLKAIVAATRAARRPAGKPVPKTLAGTDGRDALRTAPALAHVDGLPGTDEFVLLVARRERDGSLGIVAEVTGDDALLDRAIKRASVAL